MDSDHTTLETQPRSANSLLIEETGLALSIIYHSDLSRIGERHWLSNLTSTGEAKISRLSPVFYSPQAESSTLTGRALEDPYISRKPICISLVGEGVKIVGNTDIFVNGKLNDGSTVDIAQGVVINIANRVILLIHPQTKMSQESVPDFGILGSSDAVLEVRGQIKKVASLDIPVLIRGESGTGKELIANAIAQNSHRKNKPFVAVNMAAVPSSLAPAELFGTAKGAFTGATANRKGYFEQADNGTLFLDEIGEAADEIQTALLRAIETGEIQAVGSSSARTVNVRLISATDANLESKIDNNTFKDPLLQRLAGYEINIAPLRERKSDIGILLALFLQQELSGLGEKGFLQAPEEIENICRIFELFVLYDWPGNIRELKNLTRQLVIDNRGEDTFHISSNLKGKLSFAKRQTAPSLTSGIKNIIQETAAAGKLKLIRRKPRSISNNELFAALEACEWDIQATAKDLHISRASLYNLIDDHPQLRRATDISQSELKQTYISAQGDLDKMTHMLKVSRTAIKRRINEISDFK